VVLAPVKLAVIGGRRGRAFNQTAKETFADEVQIVAICDLSEEVLVWWRADIPNIQTFKDCNEMLEKNRL